MADEEESLRDFAFCILCRKNHNQGRKHVYSRKHKTNLDRVLNKFAKKIDEVREYLSKPAVENGELEPGAHFWCHFCARDVSKHVTNREVSITYGGVFEHLASEEHIKKLHKFFREHGADKDLKSKFTIEKEKFERYKIKVDEKLQEYENLVEDKRKEEAESIKKMEAVQHQICLQPPQNEALLPSFVVYNTVQNELGILQNPTGWHEGQRVWGGGIHKYRHGSSQWYPWEMDLADGAPSGSSMLSGHAIRASDSEPEATFSSDLTVISIPNLPGVKGNVHTGATPPWLRDDDNDQSLPNDAGPQIGPSLEAFQKFAQNRNKLKQNPNRVGANFNREQDTSDEWLPSFGRLWNQGPRWQSR
ncbi:centrosomal AT-AC splicing factor isoform X2 [Nematostella vectensis]|nr:centrosomal AT-AC splicing factor isoform X2 [Nematostella vectensis]